MGRFAFSPADARPGPETAAVFVDKVLDVLVEQLGHKSAEAKQMIADALDRNGAIASPEELFDEIYRGNMVK
jgi:Holliday junction DNA helicase RuvA